MCRLTAYLGAPESPAALVFGGSHSLVRQSWAPRELLSGTVNADGYGVVWYHEGRPVRTASARPIWQDDDLETLLGSVRSRTVVAALRNVTPGIPADASGIPPMVLDRWAFVLNGFLQDFRRAFMRPLHARLPDDLYASLRGVSDTETLFLLAARALRRGARPREALASVVREVVPMARDLGREAQLNLVLTDGESLAACRAASVERANSLYRATGAALGPGGTVLASEPLDDDPAWEAVQPGVVVEVASDGATVVEAFDV